MTFRGPGARYDNKTLCGEFFQTRPRAGVLHGTKIERIGSRKNLRKNFTSITLR